MLFVSYRIIYKKIYETRKEAEKALKDVREVANAPYVTSGKSTGYLVVLYDHEKLSKIEEGLNYYKSKKLPVYRQTV